MFYSIRPVITYEAERGLEIKKILKGQDIVRFTKFLGISWFDYINRIWKWGLQWVDLVRKGIRKTNTKCRIDLLMVEKNK